MDSTTLDGTVARTRVLLRAVVDAPMDSRSTPARLAKAGSKPSPQPTTPLSQMNLIDGGGRLRIGMRSE